MEFTKEEKEKIEELTGMKSNRINAFVGNGIDPVNPEDREKVVQEIAKSMKAIAAGDYVEIKDLDGGMPQMKIEDFNDPWKLRVHNVRMALWKFKKNIQDEIRWKVHKARFKLQGNYHLKDKK